MAFFEVLLGREAGFVPAVERVDTMVRSWCFDEKSYATKVGCN